MKTNKNRLVVAVALVACALCLGGGLRAEEGKDKEFSGSFMLGYRFVNLGDTASESKYREDINLEKGPRLFQFKLRYQPQGERGKLLDSLELRLDNLGGDPFESFALRAVKHGTYLFQFDRRKSAYYYADNLAAGDMHTFDFDRVNDSGLIKVWLPADAHLYMSYNRFTRKGASTASMDIGRVEYEFDKPVDDLSTAVTVGADISTRHFAIVLEERFLDYSSANSLFLPGYANGGETAEYPSELDFYFLNQPYAIQSHATAARFTLTPAKKLVLRGSVLLTHQETTLGYEESARGTDYDGSAIDYAHAGEGRFDRDIQNYNLDISWILTPRLALVGAVRYDHLDQTTGELTSDEGTTSAFSEYETGGVEGGLQFRLARRLSLTGGYRLEKRSIELPVNEPRVEAEGVDATRSGLFGNLQWSPSRSLNLAADYQYGSTDNPYTLVGPSASHRGRFTARYKSGQFFVNASYLFDKTLSDIEAGGEETIRAWETGRNQFNLRLGFQGDKLNVSAGYALIDVERRGDRTIFFPPGWSGAEGSFAFAIDYAGKSSLWDAYLGYRLGKAWDFGAQFNSYTNQGSWELSRTVAKAFLRHTFCNDLRAQVAYRYVNFKEKALGLNDYRAGICEVSVGYSW